MKLFYYTSSPGNFGDELNPALWSRVAPDFAESRAADWLVGIGTILDERLLSLPGKLLIMGSGFRPLGWDPKGQKDWEIGFVRGPLTAKVLGLSDDLALSDPALLVPRYFQTTEERTGGVGFMPHYHTLQRVDCAKACEEAGVILIPPNADVQETVRAIASVDRVVVEALHGAIVADAMGIPWVRVKVLSWRFETNQVSDFKWADWAESMGLNHETPFQAQLPYWHRRGATIVNSVLAATHVKRLTEMLRRAAATSRFQVSQQSSRTRISDRMEERVQQTLWGDASRT